MSEHILAGFGFGPIQAGLFINEAYASGKFSRLAAAEVDEEVIAAVRANKGSYYVNIARSDGISKVRIDGVEILNPKVEADRRVLTEILSQATEIVTSLPAVDFYERGRQNSTAAILAQALTNTKTNGTIIYTAENNNRAAEILTEAVERAGFKCGPRQQFLNTVIGKMSRVVSDSGEIAEMGLATIAPGLKRAFLVEEFNRILVTRCRIDGFERGIEVFIEKEDLLPFEEAKLYGHNAIHALLAYLGELKGYKKMTELKTDADVMEIARNAFLYESGGALIKKYASLDEPLFTEAGYREYAFDLLERMTNPFLADTVERAGRGRLRKLGISDRIFGTMSLALEQGIEPVNMAIGAMAAIAGLLTDADRPANLSCGDWRKMSDGDIGGILEWVWSDEPSEHKRELIKYVCAARGKLKKMLA